MKENSSSKEQCCRALECRRRSCGQRKNNVLAKHQRPEFYRLRRDLTGDRDGGGAWDRTSVVVIRSSLSVEQTSRWVRSQIAALNPTLPIDIATLHERVSKLADQPRFQTLLVGFFAATGLILALTGLYGLIAFFVTQQTQEIGIRLALGASRSAILLLIMGRSLKLIGAGCLLGVVVALAATRLLSNQLFGISAHDPATFVGGVFLLILEAVVASCAPARSASRVNLDVDF